MECPAGSPYSEQQVLYQGYQDSRVCGMCSCGDAPDVTCAAEIEVTPSFDLGEMTQVDPTQTFPADNSCTARVSRSIPSLVTDFAIEALPATPSAGGGCTASAGAATGSIDPSDPVTVCCTP